MGKYVAVTADCIRGMFRKLPVTAAVLLTAFLCITVQVARTSGNDTLCAGTRRRLVLPGILAKLKNSVADSVAAVADFFGIKTRPTAPTYQPPRRTRRHNNGCTCDSGTCGHKYGCICKGVKCADCGFSRCPAQRERYKRQHDIAYTKCKCGRGVNPRCKTCKKFCSKKCWKETHKHTCHPDADVGCNRWIRDYLPYL